MGCGGRSCLLHLRCRRDHRQRHRHVGTISIGEIVFLAATARDAAGNMVPPDPVAPTVLDYLKSIDGKQTVAGIHNREPNSKPSLQTEEILKFLFSRADVDNRWKQRLDGFAIYLQFLKDNNVSVLFRPFHEMNQGQCRLQSW